MGASEPLRDPNKMPGGPYDGLPSNPRVEVMLVPWCFRNGSLTLEALTVTKMKLLFTLPMFKHSSYENKESDHQESDVLIFRQILFRVLYEMCREQ